MRNSDRDTTQAMVPKSLQPDVRSLPPEFRLVLRLLSRNPEDGPEGMVASRISPGIDWDLFHSQMFCLRCITCSDRCCGSREE